LGPRPGELLSSANGALLVALATPGRPAPGGRGRRVDHRRTAARVGLACRMAAANGASRCPPGWMDGPGRVGEGIGESRGRIRKPVAVVVVDPERLEVLLAPWMKSRASLAAAPQSAGLSQEGLLENDPMGPVRLGAIEASKPRRCPAGTGAVWKPSSMRRKRVGPTVRSHLRVRGRGRLRSRHAAHPPRRTTPATWCAGTCPLVVAEAGVVSVCQRRRAAQRLAGEPGVLLLLDHHDAVHNCLAIGSPRVMVIGNFMPAGCRLDW